MKDLFVEAPAFSNSEIDSLLKSDMEASSRIALLAQSLAGGKPVKLYARECYQEILRGKSQSDELARMLAIARRLGMEAPEDPPVGLLGRGAFYLAFEFQLRRPYLSRDDALFHINDNPVRKDRVFRLPMVAPSAWKGHLRNAARGERLKDGSAQMTRLFGNPKEEKKDFRQGRLRFYATFFDRIGLEIINPHDRVKRIGKNPILMECAPAGSKGRFGLLYVPSPPSKEAEAESKDRATTLQCVARMLTVEGFSAKKSSGYGVAEAAVSGGALLLGGGRRIPFATIDELSRIAREEP